MALINCPECKNKISDKAESCPKCGYEINKNRNNNLGIKKNNSNYVMIVIVIILVIGAIYLFDNTNKNKGNTPNTTSPTTTSAVNLNGYSVYNDKYLGVSYQLPNNYKVYYGNDNLVYLGTNVDNQGAFIPYIVIGRYDNYNDGAKFLNEFTEYIRREYPDMIITIDLLSGTINGKTTYGIQYKYTVNGRIVIDNRYAIVVNNKVYMIGSKEENVNSAEINEVVKNLISTFTEGGN